MVAGRIGLVQAIGVSLVPFFALLPLIVIWRVQRAGASTAWISVALLLTPILEALPIWTLFFRDVPIWPALIAAVMIGLALVVYWHFYWSRQYRRGVGRLSGHTILRYAIGVALAVGLSWLVALAVTS